MVVKKVFVRSVKKKAKNGTVYQYASLVENKKVNGKVVQKTIAYFGNVTDDMIPYLKAAYMPKDIRPRLVYDDPFEKD